MLRKPYKAMDDIVQIRCHREEKRLFVELARERGITLSDLVRQCLSEAAQRSAA